MMSFEQARNYLLKIFAQHNFLELYHSKKQESIAIRTCENGTVISICFPGYKTEVSGNSIKYDYRVDLTRVHDKSIILSHTNIITDIYNKITAGNMNAEQLRVVLTDFAITGHFDLARLSEKLSYIPVNPSSTLLERVKAAHGGKLYNKDSNQLDLTREELFYALKLIVLQEDLNYPISAGKLGRKMPLMRYVETIFVSQNSAHSLEDVIGRALLHGRPHPWFEIDYSFADKIK